MPLHRTSFASSSPARVLAAGDTRGLEATWSPCLACDAAGFVVGGRYHVLERLGAGGMGVVNRVWDGMTGHARALKRPALRARRADPSSAVFSFADVRACLAHEHSVLSQLDHPGVVRVHDFGADDGRGAPYLVLDLIEPAKTIVRYAAGVSGRERLGLLAQLFEAIAYLGRAGVVHGDLKPGNVLVSARPSDRGSPSVHIVDFGISTPSGPALDADIERGGVPVGTALYLAPELLGGRAPSTASDCYAAGLLAIEVLTGVHPLRNAKLSPGLAAILDTPRLWIRAEGAGFGLSDVCASVLESLVACDPWERCTDAGEIADAFAAERRRTPGGSRAGPQLDVDVSRTGKPFAGAGVADAANIVERLPRPPHAIV